MKKFKIEIEGLAEDGAKARVLFEDNCTTCEVVQFAKDFGIVLTKRVLYRIKKEKETAFAIEKCGHHITLGEFRHEPLFVINAL